MQAVALILVLAACGGHAPPPKPPPPAGPDPKRLAHDIDDDMVELARIAHDARGNCRVTIAQLETHVERMKLHHDQAVQMSQDPTMRAQLITELDAYSKAAPDRAGAAVADLAATHRACSAGCTEGVRCPPRYQLERVIGEIPTY